MIKKSILKSFFLGIFLALTFTVYASEAGGESDNSDSTGFLYVPSDDEMSTFVKNWHYLKRCDAGENQVDEEQLKVLFSVIGRDDTISLQMENFFRDLKNPLLKQKISDYIKNNNLETPFTQALLKKYNSVEKKYQQSGHEKIQYSYEDKEFDEDIVLYDFIETHPFEDEFGLLLFNNDWLIGTLHNIEDDSPVDNKHYVFMHGGQTNSISISFTETEGVETREEFTRIVNDFIDLKNQGSQKGQWNFYEPNKTGILARCGVDDYIIYSRTGPDVFSEINAGTFGAYLYSQKYKKIYKYEYFINFSTININYQVRQRIFDYVRFFTLFGYCD